MLIKFFTILLPWPLRRWVLIKYFGFEIHRNARIGYSWIYPHKLVMKDGAWIDHFTVAIHLDSITMEAKSKIGRSNWITGLSTSGTSDHFRHQINRQASLYLGECASITKDHHLDCTDAINVGRFSTIAGYRSQFLTHSIDAAENRQHSRPIRIGDYTLVGTNVVVLGGSSLPAYSILGAKSLLNKSYLDEWTLYGGVPAKAVQKISRTDKYFSRTERFVP